MLLLVLLVLLLGRSYFRHPRRGSRPAVCETLGVSLFLSSRYPLILRALAYTLTSKYRSKLNALHPEFA